MLTIAIASDHAGFDLKACLIRDFGAQGLQTLDLGTDSEASVDYPDYADKLADAMKDGRAERGILICGSGIGIEIAANRYGHIRAANCLDVTMARLSRAHNDANVLVLAARLLGSELIDEIVRMWLSTPFDGGRHAARVAKLGPRP